MDPNKVSIPEYFDYLYNMYNNLVQRVALIKQDLRKMPAGQSDLAKYRCHAADSQLGRFLTGELAQWKRQLDSAKARWDKTSETQRAAGRCRQLLIRLHTTLRTHTEFVDSRGKVLSMK